MKKVFTTLLASFLTIFMVACSNSTTKSTTNGSQTVTEMSTTEQTTVAEVSETYKMSQEIDGGNQDVYIDLTYAGDEYKAIDIRYETVFSGNVLANLQGQGRETVEKNFSDNLDGLIPGVNAIKEMKGVEVKSSVDDKFVWKLVITMDPNVVDFEELAAKGDSFAFLADMKDTKPSQLIAGFSIAGFKKVTTD